MLGQATGILDSQDSPWPGLGGSHHLPPYSILYTSPRRLRPNGFFVPGLSKGSPETARVGIPSTLQGYNFLFRPLIGRGLKQSCRSLQELSNGVSHATCMHGSRVDSQLFVVGSQTANLIPNLFFCHNLCYKCPNGSWKPILDIYTSIAFQWYKELFNARCFDLYNCFLKVWKSIETPTPTMGAHLGVWVFILTLSHTLSQS